MRPRSTFRTSFSITWSSRKSRTAAQLLERLGGPSTKFGLELLVPSLARPPVDLNDREDQRKEDDCQGSRAPCDRDGRRCL